MVNKKNTEDYVEKEVKIKGLQLDELNDLDEVSKNIDSSFRSSTIIVGIIVIVIVSLIGFFVFKQTTKGGVVQNAAQKITQKEISLITKSAGKLFVLPKGETPVIATIKNVQELRKKQLFYKNAENGDKLLIYPKSQQAIIYSPSRNMIVNVGPVVVNNKK